MTKHLRSALFVDFDNIFISLEDYENFSFGKKMHPYTEALGRVSSWIGRLEKALDAGQEGPNRKMLVKQCYLNPVFKSQRHSFNEAGFECIDCPAFTNRGKNATDMYMAMNILDALQHPTGYDEFILLSADADFTPIVRRLREYNKRVVVVLAGEASLAYKNSVDEVIPLSEFLSILVPEKKAAAEDKKSTSVVKLPPNLEKLQKALSNMLEHYGEPVRLARVAQEMTLVFGKSLKDLKYFDYPNFIELLQAVQNDEISVQAQGALDFAFNPKRHKNPFGQQGEVSYQSREAKILSDISSVSGAPVLDSKAYCKIFTSLIDFQTDDAMTNTFTFGEMCTAIVKTNKAANLMGEWSDVKYVLNIIKDGGLDFFNRKLDMQSILQVYPREVFRICEAQGFPISSEQEDIFFKHISKSIKA